VFKLVPTQHPDLLLASFNGGENDNDGLALVWNVNFRKDTPDYVFRSQVINR